MNNEKNKRLAISLLIISMIALILFKIIPMFYSTLLAFKEYQLFLGFANSPWVGTNNFLRLFQMYQFKRIMCNTLVNNGAVLLVTVVLSTIIVTCLSNIKQKSLRTLFSLVLSFPALIPSILSSQWIIFTSGAEAIINHYLLVYALAEGVRLTGWIVLASWLISFDTADKKSRLKTLYIFCIFLLVAMSRGLTSNLELVNMLYNPLVYEKADVLDSFVYRTGLMSMKVGMTSATWVFKFLVQLMLGGFAFFGIYQILTSSKAVTVDKQRNANQIPFIVICGLLSVVVILLTMMMILTSARTKIPLSQIITPFSVGWLFISIVVAVLSAMIACVMAYPFTSYNKRVHIIYLVVLLPCSYAISTVAQYLLIRTFGLINTIPSLVVGYLLPIWMVLMMGMMLLKVNQETINSSKEYVHVIMPSALTLGGLQFSIIWGAYVQPTIMTSNPSLFTPTMMIRQLAMTGSTNLVLNLVVILPIIIVWTIIGLILHFNVIGKHVTMNDD